MTMNDLLEALKSFCKNCVQNFKLPTLLQKGDTKQEFRAPDIYKMRLPDSSAFKKLSPYIIIQIINSRDKQEYGKRPDSRTIVRFIFSVYEDNEENGAATLINVMDSVRIALLKNITIANQFQLDTNEGLDSLIYPDNTAPFFAGEMIGTFILPAIERENGLEFLRGVNQ